MSKKPLKSSNLLQKGWKLLEDRKFNPALD